jgi:hypothetical protein
MIDDNELKKIFQQQRREFADNGFSDRVKHHLPVHQTIPWRQTGTWLQVFLCGVVLICLLWIVFNVDLQSLIINIKQVMLFYSKILSVLLLHPTVYMALSFGLLLFLTGYLQRTNY